MCGRPWLFLNHSWLCSPYAALLFAHTPSHPSLAQVEAVEQVFDEADIAGQEAFEDLEKKLEQDAIRKHLSH